MATSPTISSVVLVPTSYIAVTVEDNTVGNPGSLLSHYTDVVFEVKVGTGDAIFTSTHTLTDDASQTFNLTSAYTNLTFGTDYNVTATFRSAEEVEAFKFWERPIHGTEPNTSDFNISVATSNPPGTPPENVATITITVNLHERPGRIADITYLKYEITHKSGNNVMHSFTRSRANVAAASTIVLNSSGGVKTTEGENENNDNFGLDNETEAIDFIAGDEYIVKVFAIGTGGTSDAESDANSTYTINNNPETLTVLSAHKPAIGTDETPLSERVVIVDLGNTTVPIKINEINFEFVPKGGGTTLTHTFKETEANELSGFIDSGATKLFVFANSANFPIGLQSLTEKHGSDPFKQLDFVDGEEYVVKVQTAYNDGTTTIVSGFSTGDTTGDHVVKIESRPVVESEDTVIVYDNNDDGNETQTVSANNFTVSNTSSLKAVSYVSFLDSANDADIPVHDASTISISELGTLGGTVNKNLGFVKYLTSAFSNTVAHKFNIRFTYNYNGQSYDFIHEKELKPKIQKITVASVVATTSAHDTVVVNDDKVDLVNFKFNVTLTKFNIDYSQDVENLTVALYDSRDTIIPNTSFNFDSPSNNTTPEKEVTTYISQTGLNLNLLGTTITAKVSVNTFKNGNNTGADDPTNSAVSGTKSFTLASASYFTNSLVKDGTGIGQHIKFKPSGIKITHVFLYRKQKHAHYKGYYPTVDGNDAINFSHLDNLIGSTTPVEIHVPDSFITGAVVGSSTPAGHPSKNTKVLIIYESLMDPNTQGIASLEVSHTKLT